jgi:energy-coupling factor transporter ATP-binding protein EcfA2
MLLIRYSYQEFIDNPRYWELEEINLKNINLLVGKNASGKTRILNVIHALAKSFLNTSNVPYNTGHFVAEFEDNKQIYCFELSILNGIVTKEVLHINKELFLERKETGAGRIKNHDGTFIDFKIPGNILFSTRRDELQFPYLELLFLWASTVIKFSFTLEVAKRSFLLIDSNSPKREVDLKETDKAAFVFSEGLIKHGQPFKERVIQDFNTIGYNISDIIIADLISVTVASPLPGGKVLGLHVQERDRAGTTDQNAMSDGMFRALAILIHFAYYEFENISGCILIDDIGEGLDFERATSLIKVLVNRVEKSKIQLVMSTNDKFVMNNIDLKYWQVVFRTGSKVHLHNQENSPKEFEEFKFTGLNNFEFFTTEFFKEGFSNEIR